MKREGRLSTQLALLTKLLVLVWLLLPTGCGAEDSEGAPSKSGSLNVSQGGAQDFAQFRSIVESGGVPSPDVLDEVGFFAEHAMDLPPAACGHDLCVHPMLAVAPRFDDGTWTMSFFAMNTSVDPDTLERPLLHLVVAIEQSSSVVGWSSYIATGLSKLAEGLQAEDRISLVSFGTTSETVLSGVAPDAAALSSGISTITTTSWTSPYEGLVGAQRAIDDIEAFDGAHRILMITTGRADGGITDLDLIVGLGEAIAKQGVALGVVGVGQDYEATIPVALGSLGAGTYSYAPTYADLEEVLRIEGETTLFPLATDFSLTLTPSEGYKIGRIYGVKRAYGDADKAVLQLPALFIGQRKGSHDVGGGRRGGGGGLFIELLTDEGALSIGPQKPALHVSASWTEAAGDVNVSEALVNSLAPGQKPAAMWPTFSQPDYGKAFMMLNMYLAFRSSVSFYDAGDCNRAIGVIDMMGPSVDGWQAEYDDPDIADDYKLMLMLRNNLMNKCVSAKPIKPVSAPLGCMML